MTPWERRSGSWTWEAAGTLVSGLLVGLLRGLEVIGRIEMAGLAWLCLAIIVIQTVRAIDLGGIEVLKQEELEKRP